MQQVIEEMMTNELRFMSENELNSWLSLGNDEDVECLLQYLISEDEFQLYTRVNDLWNG